MRDTTIAFKSNNQLLSLANKHSIPEDLQIKAEGDSVKSVMDIAKLNGFETTVLKKHYRSPVELIGFSNDNFYAPKNRKLEVVNDDILATEDGRVLKTHLIQSNPAAEISAKSNLTEAYYIKQLIEKIQSDERTKDKSIAVLSFFNEQAELLRRVITDDSVKISAIEGIQGDERDIVIYSLVITGPADKRRYTALTGESGEILKDINAGRVNVAFSRARLQVHAVTSLAPHLWPDGIWIKKYLEYIEKHGRVNRLSKSEQHFDSHFEEEVYEFLMQKLDIDQYRISTQVESCGFKIDQVITNIKTGRKLAIECDGPTHFDDGDGQVRVENDYDRQLVLETAHWAFYRISYIDWQHTNKTAKDDLINVIVEHFTDRSEQPSNDRKKPVEHEYVPVEVEVPAELIADQKERAEATPSRSFFGKAKAKSVSSKENAAPQAELFTDIKNEDTATPTKPVPTQNATKSKSSKEESGVDSVNSKAFSQVAEIKIDKAHSVVISRRDDESYWFNEKLSSDKYTGFTQKGFGVNKEDYDSFRQALITVSNDTNATEQRFTLNPTTELVIYHPSPETVDIRQYVTTKKYTGWTKKGIRTTNEKAKIIAKQL